MPQVGSVEEATDSAVVGISCDEVYSTACVDAGHARRLNLPIRFAALDDAEAVNPDILEAQAVDGKDAILEGLSQRPEGYELLHLSNVGIRGDSHLGN